LYLPAPLGSVLAQEPAAASHWAYRPIRRLPLPAVKRTEWPRNPIDFFILARLEKEELAPAPEADRVMLVRRLKFDLLGLPPSPEEVLDFLQDARPDAYERLVDRYLASPQFGERWARHWLDVVRFAESNGFETNLPRPNAWRYRYWVIRSFNEDKPYDQFVREQIAGDLLGADEATGFLVGGAWDAVKSPDPVLTAQQRADELHDMIATTGTAFLGLTVGCARCHDHKFDPVSQKDYYSLKAIFSGVQHGDRPLTNQPDAVGRRKLAAQFRREIEKLDRDLAALEPLADPTCATPRRMPVNPRKNVERFAPVRAKFVRFTTLATNNLEPCIDELETFTSESQARNVGLASAGTKVTSSGNFPGPPHKLEYLNDGQYGNSRSWISNETGKGWVQIEFAHPVEIDRIVWGRDREGNYQDRLSIRYKIEIALELDHWKVVASSDDRLAFGSAAPAEPTGLSASERTRYRELQARRADLEKQLREAEQIPAAYAGKFTAPEPVRLLNRGDPMQPKEPIPPGMLSAVAPIWSVPETAADSERRLELAKWITDPRNPLTHRVIVNRLWQYHFGIGLVDTPSDFGRNGSKPSHPELLDWLADFGFNNPADLAGNLKRIHRLIVTSASYRQSSVHPNSESRCPKSDQDNRFLWRFPPRRLEAEIIRDSILSVSGKLNLRMCGPGFDLFEPNSNYVKVYEPKKEFGPAEFRRMIYWSKPRMQLDDTFGVFDCPDAGQIAPRRNRSTTPLQALNLLNSPFVLQQADFFAERLRREAGDDLATQVRRGFQLAFQREPTTVEENRAHSLAREHGLAALTRALLNANEFLYVE
jgi:hypothetical protein